MLLNSDQSSLRPTPKLAAAVVLMCCTHRVCRDKIANDVDIALLRISNPMLYLSWSPKEKESK